PAPHSHLYEAHRVIEASGAGVGRPDFEKRFVHAGGARSFQEIQEQLAGKAAAAIFIADAHVQDVRLACADGHDAVAGHVAADIDHPAYIADPQTVAKNAFAPGKLVGGAFD